MIDFTTFIADELGSEWVHNFDIAEFGSHVASRPDLQSDDYVCNLLLQEIEPGTPRSAAASVPSTSVVLAQSGISDDRVDENADLLLIDVGLRGESVTQWFGYRFAASPPMRIVVSAATKDWPAVAPVVERLASEAIWSTR